MIQVMNASYLLRVWLRREPNGVFKSLSDAYRKRPSIHRRVVFIKSPCCSKTRTERTQFADVYLCNPNGEFRKNWPDQRSDSKTERSSSRKPEKTSADWIHFGGAKSGKGASCATQVCELSWRMVSHRAGYSSNRFIFSREQRSCASGLSCDESRKMRFR